MGNMIDLESFDEQSNQTTSTVKTETTNQNAPEITGGLVKIGSGSKLHDIYERFQKQVYCFDVSDSMNEGMVPGELNSVCYWNADILNQIREKLPEYAKGRTWEFEQALKEAKLECEARIVSLNEEITTSNEEIEQLKEDLQDAGDPDEKAEIKDMISELKNRVKEINDVEIPEAKNPSADTLEKIAIRLVLGFDLNNEEALMKAVYLNNIDSHVGLKVQRTGLGLSFKSKISTVKTSVKKVLEERFQKYPESDVVAIKFANSAKVISRGVSKKELFTKIEELTVNGGTDIYAAVELALNECKKAPAALGANHVILVTDGESFTVGRVETLIPQMKEKNVVLDFIFIKNEWKSWGAEYVDRLIDIAKRTGGEVVTVNNAEALTLKLHEVSTRLLLPEASLNATLGNDMTKANVKETVKQKIQNRRKK